VPSYGKFAQSASWKCAPWWLNPAAGPVFGPVVTVIPYAREAEAVAMVNESGSGLAGSVWTSDRGHGLEVARRIQAGTCGVNLYVPDLGSPWGGGGSGQGSTYGPECLDADLKPRSLFLPEPAGR
jgi:aldehyde dehydrogenase (NAD+)